MSKAGSTYPFVSDEAREKYLFYFDEKSRSWPNLENKGERILTTSYGQTFVRIGGPLYAPPLLFVPGDEETSLAFSYIIEPLSKEFRTYALDRVGDVGRSIPNPERRLRATDNMVQWLEEVVAKLMDLSEGRRVRIVAHSYGAWQTSLYAASHPQQIERMVLMAPTATVLPISIELLLRSIIYGAIPLRSVTLWHNNWFDPISMKQKKSREYLNDVIEENALAKKCFAYRKTFVPPTALTEDDLKAINSIPTLFLVGDAEVMYSPEQVFEKLNRIAPSVACKIVPDADHHMMVVNPGWVSGALLDFLNEE